MISAIRCGIGESAAQQTTTIRRAPSSLHIMSLPRAVLSGLRGEILLEQLRLCLPAQQQTAGVGVVLPDPLHQADLLRDQPEVLALLHYLLDLVHLDAGF